MRAIPHALLLLAVWVPASAPAQTIRFDDAKPQRWQIGMTVEATGAITGIYATVPVPMPWPEQQVKIVDQDVSPNVTIRDETLSGGVRQMKITIPRLNAGQTANALITLEIVKASIHAPANINGLKAPALASRELRQYLGTSPQIETSNREIKSLAEQIVKGKSTDWEKAEAIYDWVQANIKYKFDVELKGAVTALKAGHGDCEELTSLFIALCRANRIPARSVWVPGHCYPEFYLEDVGGKGHWFPCQAAGARSFGEMDEARPILQKGDNFRIGSERKRYVAETFRAKNALANPRVQFVRKQLPVTE
ncbi:MAG: transglutaminase domain-containing protein [Planctomycetes bacterium]|nr:transglutaminase domain-containing protein [Planctomycetota bacterium]MBL7041226.1 transglutaminase domain-containing protein [Pirellulaceae bacterium]